MNSIFARLSHLLRIHREPSSMGGLYCAGWLAYLSCTNITAVFKNSQSHNDGSIGARQLDIISFVGILDPLGVVSFLCLCTLHIT